MHKFFRYDWVFHGLADLTPDVVGTQVVGFLTEEYVLVIGQPKGKTPGVPQPVELTFALLGRSFQCRLLNKVMFKAEERLLDTLDHAVIVRLSRLDQFWIHLAIARRHAIVGSALEHRELLGLLRNFRDGLHRRGAGTDHSHTLAGEINAGVGEAAGVIPPAFEFLQTPELWHVRM